METTTQALGVDEVTGRSPFLGLDGLSIDAPSSLEKLFTLNRGKTVIIGNVDPVLFVQGSFDDLKEKVRECLKTSKRDSRYVLGPGCQIPLVAPLEKIKHFINCCHKYGTA